MSKTRTNYLLGVAFCMFCFFGLQACDTLSNLDTQAREDLVLDAKTWHQQQITQEESASKSGEADPSVLLNRFFPDWDLADVVISNGRTAVYAMLGPDARVSFDSTRSIVRTLIIQMGEGDDAMKGEIVEFVGANETDLDDVAGLVTRYLDQDFHGLSLVTASYSVRYKPKKATVYQPGKSAKDVGFKIKECPVPESASKRAETQYCIVLDVITYGVCVGDNECTWGTDVYMDCWETSEADDDFDDTIGSGGGGGGGDSTTGDEEDIGDVASKADLESEFAACGITNDKSQDKAYERMIRHALGMQYRAESGSSSELDGYHSNEYNGISWVNAILEAKFSEGLNPFDRLQSEGHINELNAVYNLHPEDTHVLGPPIYYAASQYAGSNMKLDYNNTLRSYAEERGVAIVHLTVRELPFGKYILFGNIATDWTLLGWRDFTIDIPESWVDNAPWSLPFSIDCNVIASD